MLLSLKEKKQALKDKSQQIKDQIKLTKLQRPLSIFNYVKEPIEKEGKDT